MRRITTTLAALALLAVPPGGKASTGSLPSVSAGPRPGPAVLYAPLATAPQLQNSGGWKAAPIMVSGADAYDDGEYIYQDFIYDDHGANTNDLPLAQPDSVPNNADILFGGMTGDVVYPTDDKTYANNAADLLEFRARLVPGGVAYRVTLNSMLDPNAAAVAIGIDSDKNSATGTDTWSAGVGSLGHLGLEHIVIVSGSGATLDGLPAPSSIDATTNQLEVTIPIDPAGATWRVYTGVGLWDATAGAFKAIADDATATSPGGANRTTPPPFFNVGFRSSDLEPMQRGALTDPLNFGSRTVGFGHWREHGQAKALAARDISKFSADIDFAKIAAGTVESHVPSHGYLNRLYASHLGTGIGAGQEGAQPARPMLLGKIQPYSVWVPSRYESGTPSRLLLNLHSLSCSYNQFMVFSPNTFTQLGDGRDSFILTTEGRGPDGWYHDEAEVDLFDAWADLAAHYTLDPDRTDVTGYSMGGYGTYKMASQYPDLFGRAWAVVGPADEAIQGGPTGGLAEDTQNTLNIMDNLYNVPLMMWNGGIDELVPVLGTLNVEKHLHDLNLRHELDLFPASDHFLLSILDEWGGGYDFLEGSTVNRDPSHVVYRVMPEMDNAALGTVHDHAYWISDIKAATGARSGLVDARSLAGGDGLPVARDVLGADVLHYPHVRKGTAWTRTTQAKDNGIVLNLQGVSSMTLWLDRAGINPNPSVALNVVVDSTTPAVITIVRGGNSTELSVPTGHSNVSITA